MVVIESLRDDATGLVTVQTTSPSGSGSEASPTSTGSDLVQSGTASPSKATGTNISLPGGSSTTVLPQSTNAAPRTTGAIARELLFGAAGAVGAGIFGL